MQLTVYPTEQCPCMHAVIVYTSRLICRLNHIILINDKYSCITTQPIKIQYNYYNSYISLQLAATIHICLQATSLSSHYTSG